MSISLSTLKPSPGSKHRVKRLGRGNASGRGTTAGRGTKGQRARQGGRKGLGQFGVKHFVSHLPKTRAFQSAKIKPQVVNVSVLSELPIGTKVTPQELRKMGLVKSLRIPVRLIGSYAKLNSLEVFVHSVSAGARQLVEAAGGKIQIISIN